MKIYGNSDDTYKETMELTEVTLSACPDVLREISKFLLKCADNIESDKDGWEHEHFKGDDTPQIIVFNPGDC